MLRYERQQATELPHLQEPQPRPRPQQKRCRSPPREPLPPCAALFISGLPVAVPGAGWKRPLEKAFSIFSARGKPRVRIARNTFNNTVGHGWIENVLRARASEAVAELDGKLHIDGQPVAVSLCVDHRDALCPKLSYVARNQLVLAPPRVPDSSAPDPLDQPSAERIAEALILFATVGSTGTVDGDLLPAVQLLEVSAGEGLATAAFASKFVAVHAVEPDPERFAALERNFSVAQESRGDGAGTGSLATASVAEKLHLHRTLEDGIAASSSAQALLPKLRVPLFGFFHNESGLADTDESESQTGDRMQWAAGRFRTLLSAGCDVVAALLPLSVDFDKLAATLVQPPTGSEPPSDERPHPFKLEFLRPSYTAEGAPRAGLWQEWQLLVVTAALPFSSAEMSFGNARLDALVRSLLGFYGKYCKEHRPLFYDWEKQRTIQLSRWKGAKLAGDHNGLTLRELRGAEQDTQSTRNSDNTAATTDVAQNTDCATSGVGGVLLEPRVRQCRLVWVLIVDGGTCDRKTGSSRKASWVGFDKGYRLRRDALARSVTAALWANPASTTDCETPPADRGQQTHDQDGPPRLVHGDSECHIIHEQTGELLSISSEFAKAWRRGGPPTEARLLKAFDDAARDASSTGGPGSTEKYVPGLTVHMDTTTVAEATSRVLKVSGLSTLAGVDGGGCYAIIELHEDKERFLPVYSAPSLAEQARELEVVGSGTGLPQPDALMMVLGCVQDHSEAVATVVKTGLSAPLPPDADYSVAMHLQASESCGDRLHLAVNVGPVSEFSSKVIHLLQAHHSANRLLPAVCMQLQLLSGESTARPASDVQAARHMRLAQMAAGPAAAATVPTAGAADVQKVHRSSDSSFVAANVDGAPNHLNHSKQVPLHFWVWFDGVRLGHLPTSQDCKRVSNPALKSNHRSAVWRVPNVVLAAFARSHGAYDNVRLSLVLEDAVVTVDGTLITKHVTERGWGALTEHHTLVALRDAIDAASPQAPVLAENFEQALKHVTTCSGDGTGIADRFVLLTDEKQHCESKYSLAQSLYSRLDEGHGTVDVPEPSEGPAAPGTHHFLLLPAARHLSASEIEAAIQNCVGERINSITSTTKPVYTVKCSTEALSPTAVAEPVRTIVALQAHNNCGALAPAVERFWR